MLIKVIEPIVYLVIIINLVIAISYKRKSKKIPVKVVAPIVILFGHNRVRHDRLKNMYISTPQTCKAPSAVLHKWSDFR